MGVLSQALANLLSVEQQAASVSGLPAAAQQIQSSLATAIPALVSQIQAMQSVTESFVQTAVPQLSQVDPDAPLPAIQAKIAAVLTEANNLMTTVTQTSNQIGSLSSQLFGYFNQLAGIESDLDSQMTALQGQLGNAQGEEEATKKRYYFLLALGPFGLFGLAAALALYLKWQSDVNGYESQISSLNAQIGSFNAMKVACQTLATDLQSVVTKISGVENSVGFVAGDILTTSEDLTPQTAPTVIRIMMSAAVTEVTTLGVDAS